ncbi:leucine-rich repeat-containing protein 15-like [Anoplophora glabripennis]|uniref:leucine-rich repeat-containing protein 15-like n=1 Tax=Anoplophora glabripennis TaxID=217634 RepID=UPI00087546EE|nr:leucine-rich repeat-containing protein 15-like [Anoplophora glabripennis]
MKISCSLFVTLIILSCVKNCKGLCKNVENEVNCESVSEISRELISQIPNIKEVTRLHVKFNTELEIYPRSFESASKLQYLVINHNKINKISSDTFQDIPLKYLHLGYNNINAIYPAAFFNLSFLQELRFENNNLKEIPIGVFTNLPIKELALSKNKIHTIENSALENLPNLKKLLLDGNNLQSIYLQELLTHPKSLEILWLHNNSLTAVTNYMLRGLKNLRILNLAMNSITFVESNSFKQTPKLSYLILSHNHLRQINGNVFPKGETSSLQNLYIDNNRLMFLPFNFFVRLGKLKNIVMVGNPWYCSCLTIVQMLLAENSITEKCNEEYSNGKKPVCVSGSVGQDYCVHFYNDDLSEKYETYKKTLPLPKRPLLCSF